MPDSSRSNWSIAAAACSIIGLGEWLATAGAPVSEPAVAGRALPAIVITYSIFGICVTLVVASVKSLFQSAGSRQRSSNATPAVAVSVLLFLVATLGSQKTLVSLAAAAALAWIGFWVFSRFPERFERASRSDFWWTLHGIIWSIALFLAAVKSTNAPQTATLITGILVAVAFLIVAGRRVLTESPASGGAILISHVVLLSLCFFVSNTFWPSFGEDLPDPSRPAVLLVTIDTLRADHVGVYGHEAARTPNLDNLAAEGVLFKDVVSQSPLTGPSHVSILTGLLPQSHEALFNRSHLPSEIKSLADDLREQGYATGAFISGWPLKNDGTGLASRFDLYDDDLREFTWLPRLVYRLSLFRLVEKAMDRMGLDLASLERSADEVTASASRWISRNSGGAFFAWVHYYDPHLPYQSLPEFHSDEDPSYQGPADGRWYQLDPTQRQEIISDPGNIDQMLSLYDGEIALVDARIGDLLESSRAAAPPAGLLTVVTADHGESMGEHDLFFYRDLYEPTVRVPLIIQPPADSATFVPEVLETVRLIDLTPTILDLLRIQVEREFDGESVMGLMTGVSKESSGPAIATMPVARDQWNQKSFSIRHDGWKLIYRPPGWHGQRWVDHQLELYDLTQDPDEARNLASTEEEVRSHLMGLLAPVLEEDGVVKLDLSADEIEKLRALGYLQ